MGVPWQYQDTQEVFQVPRDLLKRVSEPKQSSLSTFLSWFLWDLSSPSFCTIKSMTGMEVREGKEVSLMETPLHALSGTFWGAGGFPVWWRRAHWAPCSSYGSSPLLRAGHGTEWRAGLDMPQDEIQEHSGNWEGRRLNPFKKEKGTQMCVGGCWGWLMQVTRILKVDVSLDERPWCCSHGTVCTQEDFKLQHETLYGNRESWNKPFGTCSCTWKVQRKTIGIVSGFENL